MSPRRRAANDPASTSHPVYHWNAGGGAFYVMFAVAGVVLAINYVLELFAPVACPDHRGRALTYEYPL
jgi:hypothetical protein